MKYADHFREVQRLKTQIATLKEGKGSTDLTIAYLIETADTLVKAADALVNMGYKTRDNSNYANAERAFGKRLETVFDNRG